MYTDTAGLRQFTQSFAHIELKISVNVILGEACVQQWSALQMMMIKYMSKDFYKTRNKLRILGLLKIKSIKG